MPKRRPDQMRHVMLRPHCLAHPEGSVLIAMGDTQVICTASIEWRLPAWRLGSGEGWVTAEYDMLPRATHTRRQRDAIRGKVQGRSQEISRLIGRALRSVVDLSLLKDCTITVDCDVIQADGGTRCAAINGGYVALCLAVRHLLETKKAMVSPIVGQVSAVSVGLVDGALQMDLDYSMDARAEVDMNVVMAGDGRLIELQGTAERKSFTRQQLETMLDLTFAAQPQLVAKQNAAIATPYDARLAALGQP